MSNIRGKCVRARLKRNRHVKKYICQKFYDEHGCAGGARQNSLTFLFAGGAVGRGATQHSKIYNNFFCGH